MAALRSWSSGTTGQKLGNDWLTGTHTSPPLAGLWKWDTSKGFQKCENPPNPETCRTTDFLFQKTKSNSNMRESELGRICWFAVEICCSTGSRSAGPRLPGSSGLEEKAVSLGPMSWLRVTCNFGINLKVPRNTCCLRRIQCIHMGLRFWLEPPASK